MAGTKAGGLRAAKTNKERYGEGFYVRIGGKGGRNGVGKGGFASNPELAKILGAKGGKMSRRGIGSDTKKWLENKDKIIAEYATVEISMLELSRKYGINYSAIRRGIKNECL